MRKYAIFFAPLALMTFNACWSSHLSGDAEQEDYRADEHTLEELSLEEIEVDEWTQPPADAVDSEEIEAASIATWAKTFGGPRWDEGNSIMESASGEFIMAGLSASFGDVDKDFWILNLSSAGDVIWEKAYGGGNIEEAKAIQYTLDGGYIAVGYSQTPDHGQMDVWVIKLDADGNSIWQKTLGGSIYPEDPGSTLPYSIRQTLDGAYVIVGESGGFCYDYSAVIVIKVDSDGDVEWQKSYDGLGSDYGLQIQQAQSGGFIIAGGHVGNEPTFREVLIIQLDPLGNIIWQKTYSGGVDEQACSIQATSDGGYVAAGQTASYGAGEGDIWVIKLDEIGNLMWQKAYGGEQSGELAYAISLTQSGGYVVAGMTNAGMGQNAFLVLNLDGDGNVIWQKTYGNFSGEWANAVHATSDGGYIITGYTDSYGAGAFDVWVIKTDKDGNVNGQCPPGVGQDAHMQVTDTTAVPEDISLWIIEANPTVIETDIAPRDTSAYIETQCSG